MTLCGEPQRGLPGVRAVSCPQLSPLRLESCVVADRELVLMSSPASSLPS